MTEGIKKKLLISGVILGIAVLAPRSIILYFLGFFLGPLVLLLPSLIFFAVSSPLFRGNVLFLKYEILIPILLLGLSALWFVIGWPYGVKFQGIMYNYVTAIGSLLSFVVLCILFFAGRANPTFSKRWGYNWLLCYWSMSWAFALMGETHM